MHRHNCNGNGVFFLFDLPRRSLEAVLEQLHFSFLDTPPVQLTIIGLLDYYLFRVEFQLISMSVKSFCGGGTGTVREPREKGTSAVGSRCQRTGEEENEKTQCVL
jgi:hypothetical protein